MTLPSRPSSGTAELGEKLSEIAGLGVSIGESLASFTTFKVGGPAELLVRVHTEFALSQLASVLSVNPPTEILVIGQGSNLLIGDEGFAGVVIVCDEEFANWNADGTLVTAGAAVKLPVLARQCARLGLSGLEWMVGVPGSIGGAVCMNAGGHGSDVANNLVHARLVDLRTGLHRTTGPEELALRYRHSAITRLEIVVSASFQCAEGDTGMIENELAEIVRWRREHQPGGANCGSVFTNPPGDSAGRLIDAAGLRGFQIGAASVSTKHANFIQAGVGATASDIWTVVAHVRRRVFAEFGVALHPEVRTVGFDSTLPRLEKLNEENHDDHS
jgi:UDP-N-acetylmuramate dehydrogenase